MNWELVLEISIAAAAAIAQVATAYLGYRLTFKNPPRRFRGYYEFAFVVIGLIGVIAIIFASVRTYNAGAENKGLQQTILRQVTGGDNFAYCGAQLLSIRGASPALFLVVQNGGDTAMHNVRVAVSPVESPSYTDPGYASVGYVEIFALPANEAVPTLIRLEEKGYHVDISALNGTVFEKLLIKRAEGKLTQAITVRRNGAVIFDQTSPVP